MRIAIPYNEILPTGKAHDCFLFREASELAQSGCEVQLIIGKGSFTSSALAKHYGTPSPSHLSYLPILRKNNPLNLSWNFPFFYATRNKIKKDPPDILLMSVLKQAADLLHSRIPNTLYVYEVHELAYYPNQSCQQHFALEKDVLEQVDLVCVTTHQLKKILQAPPYQLNTRIEVIPLAVDARPLPPPAPDLPPTLTYVGQLYKEQGIEDLLLAMDAVPDLHLRIIGGKTQDIVRLNRHQANVRFQGYLPPSYLQEAVVGTHAFIAPFLLTGRMPYVAHTKLYDYQAWGRTLIAPDSPIVQEHVGQDACLLYKDLPSLVQALQCVGKTPLPKARLFPWTGRIQQLLSIFRNL